MSPLLGNNCRFYPSCSNYALDALKKFSTFYAIKIIVLRLIRCNPWGGSGIDLLPPLAGINAKILITICCSQ